MDWTQSLIIVKPETVIAGHLRSFRLVWQSQSMRGRLGRLRMPCEHIDFIQRISGDHPEYGEDNIAEELSAKFAVQPSTCTIRHCMTPRGSKHHADQTWHAFIRYHAKEVRACDFLTQYTAFFAVSYIFVVMEIASRRIVHVNVTASPKLSRVKQQIGEATVWGQTPRSLLHDNDCIFR